MQGTQDCIDGRLCKYARYTRRYKVNPYIIGGKLARPDFMICHIWSLKIIYECQRAMNLRRIMNVRPNTTTKKKNIYYTVWILTSMFLLIFSSYYHFIPQYSWKTEDHCYIHSGLMQATILISRSAKLHLTEACSRCQLTWWSQLVIKFVLQYYFQTCSTGIFCPFIYLFLWPQPWTFCWPRKLAQSTTSLGQFPFE